MISDSKTRFTLVIDKELKEKLQILADEDKRSLGNYIQVVLENHIKEQMDKDLE